MPPENQAAAAKANEPEQIIEVDLTQTDPTKAVTRSERTQAAAAASAADDGGSSRSENWAERSRAVQKRIGRMQRSFDQRIADMEAKSQQERAELRAELERLRTERREAPGSQTEAAHKAKMDEMQRALEQAIEKGDSATQARITREMQQAEGAYWDAKTRAQGAESAAARTDGTARAAAATGAPARTGPTPAGSRFILANEDWWSDPEFAPEKSYANAMFSKLVNDEGFDPNDDETFDEVVARVNAKFPQLQAAKGQRRSRRSAAVETDHDDGEGESARAAGGGARRAALTTVQDRGNADTGASVRGRRTLTKSDIATMRAVGMNPDSNDHVMRFLREQQSLDAG